MSTFAIPNENNTFESKNSGAIAQLVEQRTENPCVPGSIPGGTTENPSQCILRGVFICCCRNLINKTYLARVARFGFRNALCITKTNAEAKFITFAETKLL